MKAEVDSQNKKAVYYVNQIHRLGLSLNQVII